MPYARQSPAARSSKNSAVETRLHPRPADAEPEEEAPYEDDDTEMNPAMLASPKTRITRTPKVKTTRAGRPSLVGLDHLHHGGSDGVQTSRCTLCNLIFYNAPPFAASSWYATFRASSLWPVCFDEVRTVPKPCSFWASSCGKQVLFSADTSLPMISNNFSLFPSTICWAKAAPYVLS